MKKVIIIGAGKTGRGFLARLLADNQIVFIDKNQELIEKINQKSEIDIKFFGDKMPPVKIAFNKAITWEDVSKEDFENVDCIFVSVGGTNLNSVGESLKNYVNASHKIIVCENASKPAKKLKEAIGLQDIKVAESTVFCTTIEREKGSVEINSEWYPYLQFDIDALGEDVDLQGIKPVKNFGGFLDRKLFTYNSASCIIAYLGALKGYSVYSDAANDQEILELLDKNYEIINQCICDEYGYELKDQQEFALLSRDKFTNKTLVDTVARNAREPQRKITPNERIVSPLLLQVKYGKDSSVLEKTLAAALLYTPEEETEWNEMIATNGYENILTQLCGLDANSEVYKKVLNMVKTGKVL